MRASIGWLKETCLMEIVSQGFDNSAKSMKLQRINTCRTGAFIGFVLSYVPGKYDLFISLVRL